MQRRTSNFGIAILVTAAAIHLFSADGFGKRLPLRIFTSADGLGSSFVNYLARDSRGFMWFCTRDGLSRFDGSRFVTYQIGDENSPPGIENIYEARDGAYWITTTGGTYRFDPNRLTTTQGNSRTLNAEKITGLRGELFEDRAGNFWLGSVGLYKIEIQNGKFAVNRRLLGLPPRENLTFSISDLDEASDGALWINSTWGITRLLPDGRIEHYTDELKKQIVSGSLRMIGDKNGRVWLARDNRLYSIKPPPLESLPPDKMTLKSLQPTAIVAVESEKPVRMPKLAGEIYQYTSPDAIDRWYAKNIYQSVDGSIWIASEENLIQINESAMMFYSNREGLPNVMGRMVEDNVGNLWIASRNGAVRLDRRGLVSYGKEDGAASNRFQSIVEGADGAVYFGNPNAEVSRFDGRIFTSAKPHIPGNRGYIWTTRNTFIDSRGDYWLLTGGGLYRFSGVTDFTQLNGRPPTRRYGIETGLRSDGAFQIYEDSSGDIWVSSRGSDGSGHGLSRLRVGEENFRVFDETSGLPPGKSPSSFAEDRLGNLWIGFYDGGLARFDGERFRVFGSEQGFQEESVVTDVHLDARGRLWISTAAVGVLRVDDPGAENPRFVRIDSSEGLASNNVRSITEDKFGRIYIGSARGVDRLTPDTGHVKHYSTADGLANDFVSDSFCDSRGDLWFATDSGISRLVPVPDERAASPNVWVQSLRIAGEPQPTLELGSSNVETQELTDSQNNLQIEFFGIDHRAGESLKFQYKLEGADADWSAPTEERTVTFANLKPEKYRFLVRAINSEGAVSDNPATVSFIIVPPVYQRTWFVLLSAFALAVVTALVFRYRTENLRRVNRALREAKIAEEKLRRSREERLAELESVRARIATDLHDDIGSSLTQIAILSEVAQTKANGGNGAMEPLARITDVSNELVGTMSDIVWSINPEKDHFSDLVQRMRRFAADVLTAKGLQFQFLAPDVGGETIVSSNVRREVFLIFKETVNNIVKHSEATSARIELTVENNEVVFRITDNGVGFDPDNPRPSSGGHGIGGMRDRAEELGGRLLIISEPGSGTTVSLSLPLGENAFA